MKTQAAFFQNSPIYRTSSIDEAATLLTLDQDLQNIEIRPNGYADFIFTSTPELRDIVKKFWAQACPVDILTFKKNFKDLKNRAMTTKGGPC